MDQDLKLSSSAFEGGGIIPRQYTSEGDDVNPPLTISGAGDDVRSIVLIMDDPDAAIDPDGPGKVFDHWVVFNIPPDTRQIGEGASPPGAIVAKNGAGQNRYIGLAPPNGEHRYFFKLYGLSEPLGLGVDATKEDVEAAMEGKIRSQTQLMAKYQRAN